jgi:putative ABC transport system substrate-binding protein
MSLIPAVITFGGIAYFQGLGVAMRRRDFVKATAISAVTWPFVARAQQSTTPVIGFMHARSQADTAYLTTAFLRALAENGFIENQTLKVLWRFADGHYDQLPPMAVDLVGRSVSLIVAGSDPAALAAKHASASVPIVFAVGGDPVQLQLVQSLNEPRGNATGISILTGSLEPKRLGLFRDLLGPDRTVAVLINPKLAPAQKEFHDIETATKAIGWQPEFFWVSSDAELDTALEKIQTQHLSALEVAPDPFFDTRREKVVGWATRNKVPSMFHFREYPVAGGLMSYGIDIGDAYRQLGIYAARVLKGEKTADLPVLQPSKFEFVINMKTAKVLGLSFPPGLLSIADEVIE